MSEQNEKDERQINSTDSRQTIEFDKFSFDAAKKLLWSDGRTVQLAPKACEILGVLLEHAPQLVSKEELMNLVWSDSFVEEANLAQHISALRKAFGEDKNGRKFIETIPRKGYRFVAKIRESENGATAEIVITERDQISIAVKESMEISERLSPPVALVAEMEPRRKNRRPALLGAIGVMIALIAGFAIYAAYKFARSAPADFVAGRTTRLTTSGRVKTAVISPDGTFVIYVQDELDDRQTLHLKHIGSESDTEIAVPNVADFRSLAISPDGNRLYFINEHLTLFEMPVFGGTPRKIAERVNSPRDINTKNITFSPDGSQVAFVRRSAEEASSLIIVNTNDGGERQLAWFDNSTLLAMSPSWSPDGKIILCYAFAAEKSGVLAFQVADGTYTKILENSRIGASSVWSPDARSFFTSGISENLLAEQIWQVSYPSGEARQITADSNNYENPAFVADKKLMMAIKSEASAQIWTMPANETRAVRQLTVGFEKHDGTSGIGWLPNNEIYYSSVSSGKESVWISQADGDKARQAVKGSSGTPTASPDGHFLVYQRDLSNTDVGLWRMNLSDGTEEKITRGVDVYPTFTPDGSWIIFTRFGEKEVALVKMPAAGGEPTMLYNEFVICPAISPDGKTVAANNARIALVGSQNGELIKKLNVKLEFSKTSTLSKLQWAADGRGIYFVSRASGASNIWRQPVDGSAPVQVTDFKDGKIFNFAFSPDQSQILLSRGTYNSDIVLIENAK